MDNQAAAAPKVVNLAHDLPQETGVLETVFPGTNNPTGWNIILAGPSHPQSLALFERTDRARLDKQTQIEATQVNGRKWKPTKEDPAAARREFVTDLVARIVGWNTVDFGWGPIEFNPATAVDTLLRPELGGYVAQIVNYLAAERAFYKDSAKI